MPICLLWPQSLQGMYHELPLGLNESICHRVENVREREGVQYNIYIDLA